MKHNRLLIGSLLLVWACSEAPTAPDQLAPMLSIEDAVHSGGNEHFFWLPPMVASPAYSGTFDGALSPVVEICEWDGSACVMPLVTTFTMTSGPGSETIRVEAADEHYIANWHTDEFGLDDTKTYRIRVRVDNQELGHADVDVVSSGKELKNVDSDEYIPLKDGRTLPIKFRIEDGAISTCAIIEFVDAGLDAAVRDLLMKPTGDITDVDVAGRTALNARSRGITDLSGIECMTDLRDLYLASNQIPDLTPLAPLTGLRLLELTSNTALTDLGPLTNNTTLETFNCLNCFGLTDLGPLSGATNMRRIDLRLVSTIQSLAALSGMTQLEFLRVHSPPITDISPLVASASTLVHVDIGSTKVADLSPLANAANLEYFAIFNSDVADLSPMVGWSAIRTLSMHLNPLITDLSPLAGLVTLEAINTLASNGITDLSPLSGLVNLRDLRTGSAQIADLTPISGLTGLEILDIRGVADISPISGLVNLKQLLIQQANPDLSPISTLVNLEFLSANEMNTADLSPLIGLNSLATLDLSRHYVLTDLTPLQSLPALTWLDVDQSNISDTSPLAGIPALARVNVKTNPIDCSTDTTLAALAAAGVTVLTDCF